MGKSQEGKQERNRRKQRGNAEEDRNLKRDRDLEKEKVESLYVTREMAEDKEMDEKIRQDLIHVADQAEKEFQEEEALGAPRMKPEEKQQLFDDIVGELKKKDIWEESPEDQLSAEDREALRLGRELLNNPKKKRSAVIHKIFKGVAGAAVVAVGVFVLSMSSEANREKVLSVWNSLVGEELRTNIDVSEDGTKYSEEFSEQKAFDLIKNELGIDALKIIYIPNGMYYDSYLIDQEDGMAIIYYRYNNSIITVYMYKESLTSSHSQKFDGEIIDSIDIHSKEIKTKIWKVDGDQESFASGFEYNNAYYMISGNMPEDEFKKMIASVAF